MHRRLVALRLPSWALPLSFALGLGMAPPAVAWADPPPVPGLPVPTLSVPGLPVPPLPVPTPAQRGAPQRAARIEILIIDAIALPGPSSPALDNIPQLRQPPFSAFGALRLVSRRTLPLTAEPQSTPLPNRRGELSVSLSGQTAGRYNVNVQFTRSTTSTIQFVAAPGEPFFTVRAHRPDKALVLGFIVR